MSDDPKLPNYDTRLVNVESRMNSLESQLDSIFDGIADRLDALEHPVVRRKTADVEPLVRFRMQCGHSSICRESTFTGGLGTETICWVCPKEDGGGQYPFRHARRLIVQITRVNKVTTVERKNEITDPKRHGAVYTALLSFLESVEEHDGYIDNEAVLVFMNQLLLLGYRINHKDSLVDLADYLQE
jgi:hypothetical protein